MIKFNGKLSFQIILIIAIISSIVFVIPNIPNSYAHAFVTKSDPAPSHSLSTQPSKVDVYFSDPIDIRYSQLKVLNSSGGEIQEKDQHYINNDESTLSVSLPPGLKDGIYTVITKVLDQTDGHVTENAFVFAIGQAIPQNFVNPTSNNYQEISIPEAIARFPALVGQVMVVGASFATLWLWRPISRIPWLGYALAETRIKIDRHMIKLAVIGSVILLSSGFAMILVQAYSIDAGILDAISTKFGSIWIIRMIASAALFALSFTMYQKIKKSNAILPKSHVLGLLEIGLIVLVTTSLISHGAATGKILPLILDFIHNVVAKSKTVTETYESKSILSNFSKSTKIESLIGIALLASVAVLVDSGVPSSEFQNQLQLIQEQNVFALATPDNTISKNLLIETKFVENGSRIVLTINPFSTGNNDFKISFLDSNKNPINMKSVQLRLIQVDRGIGPITIDAQQDSTGVFS